MHNIINFWIDLIFFAMHSSTKFLPTDTYHQKSFQYIAKLSQSSVSNCMFGGFVCRRVVCMYVVSRTSFTWTDEVSKGKWRGSRKNHQQQTLYDSLLLSRKLPHFWPLNELFSLSLSVVMAKSINEIRDCCDILPLGRKRKKYKCHLFFVEGVGMFVCTTQ